MTDERYNPKDPLFLLSRTIDGDLDEAGRRELDRLLEENTRMREELRRFQAVDDLVKQWGRGAPHVNVDWDRFGRIVRDLAVPESEAAGHDRIDGLLRRWGAKEVTFDEARFTASVMRKIRRREAPGALRRLVLRVGFPLAAAAAIALTVFLGPWTPSPPPGSPAILVALRTTDSIAGGPGRIVVRFAQEPMSVTPSGQEIEFIELTVNRQNADKELDDA